TNAITALSARFDKETNRTLARTASATFEFSADDLEISVPIYPVESVTKFETKTSESAGWIEQTSVEYLIRTSCIISLSQNFSIQPLAFSISPALARVTYTGGYVLPGTTPSAGQTALPSDIEQAAVEQIAFWFTNRDKLGLDTNWPKGGVYQKFATLDLLPNVQNILKRHQRFSI